LLGLYMIVMAITLVYIDFIRWPTPFSDANSATTLGGTVKLFGSKLTLSSDLRLILLIVCRQRLWGRFSSGSRECFCSS